MIKAVLIDVDNTLLDFNKSAEISMKSACEKFNLPFSERFFNTFKTINDGLWQEIEKKTLTREQLHRIRWQIIFQKLGIEFDGVLFEKVFYDNLEYCAVPVDGAVDVIKYLSRKYDVYTASNSNYQQQINRLGASDLLKYIKKPFASQKLGFNKPDVRFFEACFKEIGGIKKEETILIGDSFSADIIGGKNFGIKTVWFNFEKTDVAEKHKIADYIITDLNEIKNIL